MAKKQGAPPHVLVINNDAGVLSLFQALLEDEGYRVTIRGYLDHDLSTIKQADPDLILLDYMWSTDDNSWALLQMLRMDRETAKIPIVLCSAAKNKMEELSAHLHAMDIAVVLKPFDIDQLLSVVTARCPLGGDEK